MRAALAPALGMVLALALGTPLGAQPEARGGSGAQAEWAKAQAEREQRERRQHRRRMQRAQAHARMSSTMYASTPDPADAAVFWHPVLPASPQPAAAHTLSDRGGVARAALPASAATEPYRIPVFAAASDPRRQGFARIINRSDEAGTVRIDAFDDAGERYGPLTLDVGAGESVHFNSSDLENGNPAKGLSGGVGAGTGAWRLEMATPLDLEVLGYMRTRDGFLTAMHDLAPHTAAGHRVAFFNPGGNASQVSRLRLINPGAEAVEVTIEGIDGNGDSPGTAVRLSLPARASRTLTARQLESGEGEGLSGALGDGAGKWRLLVHSEQPLRVMSLLSSPTGHLTNLSTAPDNAELGEDGATTTHDVPLFPSTTDPRRQGFARIINRSDEAGTVRIDAFDDTGERYGPLTLDVGAGESVHFNSSDLEDGNPAKGWADGVGTGTGDWRLTLGSRLDLRVLSYIRTHDGFLTAMHDLAPHTAAGHRVAFFNPGGNASQVSRLRLINPGAEAVEVTIEGIDGNGDSPGTAVRLSLPARASRTLTARQLESGEGEGLSGALGDGAGKWRLLVHSPQPLRVMSLLSSPTGHLTNLSTAPTVRRQTAEEVFRQHVSGPVVQAKCVNCHVAGGISGHTRLVFARSSSPDHLALNLRTFEDFFAGVEGAAALILNKIQGVGHGGGVQVAAGTAEFADVERFLALLGGDVGGPALTPGTLFDTVRMEPLRDTLRRAALVLAGRPPTEAEYAAFAGDAAARRATLRGLMSGPGFHEFLIRGANDRLLVDRAGDQVIDFNLGYFVDYTNEAYRRKKAAHESGDEDALWKWADKTRHGFRRAPLELIAHVVENDLPYTEILTAGYIMANPYAARAYGDDRTRFDDPEDFDEFRPSRILGYYCKGDGFVQEHDLVIDAYRVTDPGALRTDYPHAGVLNTTVFLGRYPTTATNRNRARSRWTWYHFLGLDVEKSAPRTTDPEALADTNNPTMHNPACTVCHRILDPVAGLFQNYGEMGYYRDQWGGRDSLDELYKNAAESEAQVISAGTWQERETLRWPLRLQAGTTPLAVTYYKGEGVRWVQARLDRLRLKDGQGRVLTSIEFEDLEPTVADWGRCGDRGWNEATRRNDHLTYWGSGRECALWVDVETPAAGDYTAEVVVWKRTGPGNEETVARISVANQQYRTGDTWYRDMRVPGFEGAEAPNPGNSVQWLAARVAADERFAEAAVRFWWPAVMGSEVAEPPESADDADFEGRLLAANAQAAEVERLARGFRQGFRDGRPYNLKDLLAEIALSRWFRAGALTDADPVRRVALRDAGARRLLTPEELARKTAALTGFQWGRRFREWPPLGLQSHLSDDYGLLYGGIDSDGITERARDLTAVMDGVARRHAAQVSCPVVVREFYLGTEADRRLFDGIGQDVTPVAESSAAFEIESDTWGEGETHALDATLTAGPVNVRLTFTNDYYSDDHGDRNLHLDRLDLRNAAGRVVASYELERLDAVSDCNGPNGRVFSLHCRGGVDVPMEVPADGRYRIEVVAWGERAGDALPELAVTVESDAEHSAGARAIRDKLVELHDRLLGVQVSPHSPDVEAAYRLFVDVWQRNRASGDNRLDWWRCDYSDALYLEGINDALVPLPWGDNHTFAAFMEGHDFSDPHHTARTWTVVLAYLLMDYRYLYL